MAVVLEEAGFTAEEQAWMAAGGPGAEAKPEQLKRWRELRDVVGKQLAKKQRRA